VLSRDLTWYVAFVMAAATVATIFALSRRHEAPRQFRVEDSPPQALQVAWALLFLAPQLYSFFTVVAPAYAYRTVLTFSFPFDEAFQVAGLGVWVAGGLLVLWAGRALGRFMMIQIAVTSDHELITIGPYARIRHPTYTGAIFLTMGIALVFLNVALLAAAGLVVTLANYRAQKEERLLASPEGFGAKYRQYMARTGRFLPRPRRA
jgi:protein-S-isoprenylcysteine O-methyltransferase Ste14